MISSVLKILCKLSSMIVHAQQVTQVYGILWSRKVLDDFDLLWILQMSCVTPNSLILCRMFLFLVMFCSLLPYKNIIYLTDDIWNSC